MWHKYVTSNLLSHNLFDFAVCWHWALDIWTKEDSQVTPSFSFYQVFNRYIKKENSIRDRNNMSIILTNFSLRILNVVSHKLRELAMCFST